MEEGAMNAISKEYRQSIRSVLVDSFIHLSRIPEEILWTRIEQGLLARKWSRAIFDPRAWFRNTSSVCQSIGRWAEWYCDTQKTSSPGKNLWAIVVSCEGNRRGDQAVESCLIQARGSAGKWRLRGMQTILRTLDGSRHPTAHFFPVMNTTKILAPSSFLGWYKDHPTIDTRSHEGPSLFSPFGSNRQLQRHDLISQIAKEKEDVSNSSRVEKTIIRRKRMSSC